MRINIITFFTLALFTFSGVAQAGEAAAVAATVNGVPVATADVENEVDRIIRQSFFHRDFSPEKREEQRNKAVENLIDRELLRQEARRQGHRMDEKDLKSGIATIKKRFASEDLFAEALRKKGMSRKEFEAGIERDTIIRKLLDTEIEQRLAVSGEELKSYYDANPDKFREPEKVRLRHIVIGFTDPDGGDGRKGKSARNMEEARSLAEAIAGKIGKGVDFASLAMEYSEDAYRDKGGDLGYIHRGMMLPQMEQAAFDLKSGETMGPLETEDGFYIIKVEDRKPEMRLPLEEVREKIQKELEGKQSEELKKGLLQRLREQAKIEYTSSDKES